MKKLVLVRVAILLVLAAATVAALVGGRAGASQQARPGIQKTEVVALHMAKTVPIRHARCRARAGI
jgi:hypothetical protein